MRVALLPSAYHPAVGGVELLTAKLAATLRSRGHDVEVWTYGSAGVPDHETVDGIDVRRYDFALPAATPGALRSLPRRAWATGRHLDEAARRFRPDVLHVQCFSGNGVYALGLSELRRIPLVVSLHGETAMDDHHIFQRSAFLRRSLRAALRRADVVTGCSRFTLEHATDLVGRRRTDAEVVFNATDLDEAPAEDFAVPFRRYVAAVGRVVTNKGFDLLLAAFAELAGAHPGVGLVVGGAGAQLDGLRAQAGALGVADRVHFPGRLRPGEVAALMIGAEVVVMPSRVEPFGIVALEGWRSGTPVVVTSRGGPPEFVRDGVDGLVADPLDRAALAGALDRVLSDPALGRRLAEEATRRLACFSWPVIAERYESLYRAAVGR